MTTPCPDCGVVGGPVCGSPDDPTGGLDCYRRVLANGGELTVRVPDQSELGRCTSILPTGYLVVDFEPEDRASWVEYRPLAEVEEVWVA